MNLDFFISVQSTAFKDDAGVYLNNERIALSNGQRNGYIRYNGELSFTVKGFCDGIYDVETPLLFIGAAPNCTEAEVHWEVMNGVECNDFVTDVIFDKQVIAESEGIALEDLQKFDGVTMVMVEYTTNQTISYSPSCDFALC